MRYDGPLPFSVWLSFSHSQQRLVILPTASKVKYCSVFIFIDDKICVVHESIWNHLRSNGIQLFLLLLEQNGEWCAQQALDPCTKKFFPCISDVVEWVVRCRHAIAHCPTGFCCTESISFLSCILREHSNWIYVFATIGFQLQFTIKWMWWKLDDFCLFHVSSGIRYTMAKQSNSMPDCREVRIR